jgi:hypothetical protein
MTFQQQRGRRAKQSIQLWSDVLLEWHRNGNNWPKSLTLVSVACASGWQHEIAGRTLNLSQPSQYERHPFWHSVQEIAHTRKMKVSDLIGEIDAQPRQGNLSSALRVFVLEFYRSQIPNPPDGEGVAG